MLTLQSNFSRKLAASEFLSHIATKTTIANPSIGTKGATPVVGTSQTAALLPCVKKFAANRKHGMKFGRNG